MLIHKGLKKSWQKLSLVEQLANIGSEVYRAKRWQGENEQYFNNAVDRALELFDLTIADPRWKKRLKEICRVREIFCDIIFGDNQYNTTLEDLDKYFYHYAVAARLSK